MAENPIERELVFTRSFKAPPSVVFNKDSEAGVLPDERILTEMGKYNEELVQAGVLLAAEGLHTSSKGARVKFSGARRAVVDGPFTEVNDLVAGFWLWHVKSKEEALEWVKRIPFEAEGRLRAQATGKQQP